MNYFLKYEDDDCIDLSEFKHQKSRKSFWCSDRMCGADDCGNCRPMGRLDDEPEGDDE